MNDDLPCRVSIDTALHYAALNRAEQAVFDEYDEDLMKDIFGGRLAKPAQELLVSLHQIEMIQGSFGEPDKAKAFDRLLVELKAFREAAKDAWRDL